MATDRNGVRPLRQSSRETRLAISNGFLGVRGVRALTRRGAHRPGRTYVAGLFGTASPPHSVSARAPGPDWLRIRLATSSRPIAHDPDEISDHRMILDLRRGLVSTERRYVEAEELRLRVRSLRLVSLSQRHVGLQTQRLMIDSGATDVVLEAGFEGFDLGLISTARQQDSGAPGIGQRPGGRLPRVVDHRRMRG